MLYYQTSFHLLHRKKQTAFLVWELSVELSIINTATKRQRTHLVLMSSMRQHSDEIPLWSQFALTPIIAFLLYSYFFYHLSALEQHIKAEQNVFD